MGQASLPKSSRKGIGVYTPTATPRAPCMVMQHAVLCFSDQQDLTSLTTRKIAQILATVFWPILKTSWLTSTSKTPVVQRMHGALEKKDFFPGEVCPLYFSEKYRLSKSKHIHRKVKCAHLVPEPGSRWRRHVVLGSKKKNHLKTFGTNMHRYMHRTDVVLELAGRRSISLVARSKK